MSVSVIFKIGAVGILVTILGQVLKHSGREEQACLTSFAGLLLVLFWILPYIIELFEQMEDEYLAHYGTKRHSGRYPWGSGEDPYQHGMDFLARYHELKKSGMKDVDIAKELNMVDKDGKVVHRFGPTDEPKDFEDKIKELL